MNNIIVYPNPLLREKSAEVKAAEAQVDAMEQAPAQKTEEAVVF